MSSARSAPPAPATASRVGSVASSANAGSGALRESEERWGRQEKAGARGPGAGIRSLAGRFLASLLPRRPRKGPGAHARGDDGPGDAPRARGDRRHPRDGSDPSLPPPKRPGRRSPHSPRPPPGRRRVGHRAAQPRGRGHSSNGTAPSARLPHVHILNTMPSYENKTHRIAFCEVMCTHFFG